MFKSKSCSGGDGCLGGVLAWGPDDIRDWDVGQGLKGKGKNANVKPGWSCSFTVGSLTLDRKDT